MTLQAVCPTLARAISPTIKSFVQQVQIISIMNTEKLFEYDRFK